MNLLKIFITSSLAMMCLISCGFFEADEVDKFGPGYGEVLGCWVNRDGVDREDNYTSTVTVSSCREICLRKDSTITIHTNVSYDRIKKNGSAPEMVRDSFVDAYGTIIEFPQLSMVGEFQGTYRAIFNVAVFGHLGVYDTVDFDLKMKNGSLYSLNPHYVEYSDQRGHVTTRFSLYEDDEHLYHRSQSSECSGSSGSVMYSTQLLQSSREAE